MLVQPVGYWLVHFVVKPVKELRATMQATDRDLRRYAAVIAGSPREIPKEELAAAFECFRTLHADLKSIYGSIPLRRLLAVLHLIPSRPAIRTAVTGLTYLANTVSMEYTEAKTEHVQNIKHALKLIDL